MLGAASFRVRLRYELASCAMVLEFHDIWRYISGSCES